jgi:hypothetical protein
MATKSSSSSSSSGGIGFFGLLTILFVAMKIMGYINWSWWWVFSPMLIGAGLWIFFLVLLFSVVFWARSK